MNEQYRVYQYQTDCLLHNPEMPQKGDWVIQQKSPGGKFWYNFRWPYGSKEEAEKELEVLQEGK